MIAIPSRSHIQIGLLPALFDWKENGATIVIETAILIDNARNRLTQSFVDSDKEYLLFIDSDIVPSSDALRRLIDHDKDIVSGYHNIVHEYNEKGEANIIPSSSKIITENSNGVIDRILINRNEGLVKVEGVATSFLLIKRKVFKDWKRPWFKMKWNDDYTNFIGEDYYFCIEARKRGFEIYTDSGLLVRHVKEIIL